MTAFLFYTSIQFILELYFLENKLSEFYLIDIPVTMTLFFGSSVLLAILIKFKHNKNYSNEDIHSIIDS